MSGRGIPDRTLLWGTATTQLIGWGTLYVPFPLTIAPIEAEMGWSRVLLNAAYTCGLLAAGLGAVPAGRWLDRRGPRGMMTLGAFGASAALLAMSVVRDPASYVALWILIGVLQAMCLWGTAMAVVVAEARETTRTITAITFITGFTGTVFIPITDWLIGMFGWRGAMQALAVLQFGGAVLTWAMLRDARIPARGGAAAHRPGLLARLREPAFAGLAFCFAAHAFIATGLAAHMIPLLRERGWPEAMVLLLASAHGPAQVTARGVLFLAGKRATMRGVGRLATGLLPLAMLALAAGPSSLPLTILFVGSWAAADGLLTIVRSAGAAEILGREGFGAINGALSAVAMLPRTGAPVVLALVWEEAGGYAPVPWILVAAGLLAAGSFLLAASPQFDRREAPISPPT